MKPVAASSLREVQRIFEGDRVKVGSKATLDGIFYYHGICFSLPQASAEGICGKWLTVMEVQPCRDGWMVSVPNSSTGRVSFLFQDCIVEVQPSAARPKTANPERAKFEDALGVQPSASRVKAAAKEQKRKQDEANSKKALGFLPKFFKETFSWDLVKKIAVEKVSKAFLSRLLVPFGLSDVVKDIVIEVVNGVCHIIYRAVVDKKSIDLGFLKKTVKDVFQGCVQALGLDVVVSGIFDAPGIADSLDECIDDVKAVQEVAEEEEEEKKAKASGAAGGVRVVTGALLEICRAGSSEVNGIYRCVGNNRFEQQHGTHTLLYWGAACGWKAGWYVSNGHEAGRYFAPGGADTVPIGGWEVYTGPVSAVTRSPAPYLRQAKFSPPPR